MSDASDTIRRLEAELVEAKAHHMEALRIHIDYQKELRRERDNVARNERIRIADRADSLAHDYRHGTHSQDVFEGAARSGAARALEALAAELRVEGGGT